MGRGDEGGKRGHQPHVAELIQGVCRALVGVPRMATSSATPSTAPSCRAVWWIAPPMPKRTAGRPDTAAELSTGNVRATPRPTSHEAGNQCDRYCGSAVTTETYNSWPAAKVRPPATRTGQYPILATSRPVVLDSAATTSGPGVIASPARRYSDDVVLSAGRTEPLDPDPLGGQARSDEQVGGGVGEARRPADVGGGIGHHG